MKQHWLTSKMALISLKILRNDTNATQSLIGEALYYLSVANEANLYVLHSCVCVFYLYQSKSKDYRKSSSSHRLTLLLTALPTSILALLPRLVQRLISL